MQPPREPPPRQIPIDRRPLTQPPRVPSLKAFRRRPSTPVDRPRRAAIRNPAHDRPAKTATTNGRSGSKSGPSLVARPMAPTRRLQPSEDMPVGNAPAVTMEMAKGFTLFIMKAVMSGRGDQLFDLVRTNLWR